MLASLQPNHLTTCSLQTEAAQVLIILLLAFPTTIKMYFIAPAILSIALALPMSTAVTVEGYLENGKCMTPVTILTQV